MKSAFKTKKETAKFTIAFKQLPFYLKGQRVYSLYVKSLLRVMRFLNISIFNTEIAQSEEPFPMGTVLVGT